MTSHELLVAPIAYMPPARILNGLSASQAATRTPGAPHTIVEVLAHLDYWQAWFLDRVMGRPTPMASVAADGWPSAGASDWEPLRERFVEGLDRAVAFADEEDARTRPVTPPIEFPPLAEYTVADAMAHLAMHNAHHLGQVVTLRQLQGAWPPPEGSWTW